jgi:hypothetical protein
MKKTNKRKRSKKAQTEDDSKEDAINEGNIKKKFVKSKKNKKDKEENSKKKAFPPPKDVPGFWVDLNNLKRNTLQQLENFCKAYDFNFPTGNKAQRINKIMDLLDSKN